MCTPFPTIMPVNRTRMDPAKWNALYQCALKHFLSTLQLYRIQLKEGRHILHDPPDSAASLQLQETVELMNECGC